jgi:hypothetical protein
LSLLNEPSYGNPSDDFKTLILAGSIVTLPQSIVVMNAGSFQEVKNHGGSSREGNETSHALQKKKRSRICVLVEIQNP